MENFDIVSYLMGRQAGVLSALPTDTASGNPANFPDGAKDAPVISLKLPVSPVQEGSGTPGPENLRPISECEEVNLYHSGADTADYETIPVSVKSAAGPVYGGTADAAAGTMTIDRVLLTLDGSMEWSVYSSGGTQKGFLLAAAKAGLDDAMAGTNSVTAPYVLCSLLPNSVGHSTWARGYCGMQNKNIWFGFTAEDFDGVTAFKTYANKHPIQMVLPVETPSVVRVSPRQITTFYGENNFWVDAGDVEVEYRADLELYIEKKTQSGGGGLGLGNPLGASANLGMDDAGVDYLSEPEDEPASGYPEEEENEPE